MCVVFLVTAWTNRWRDNVILSCPGWHRPHTGWRWSWRVAGTYAMSWAHLPSAGQSPMRTAVTITTNIEVVTFTM